MIYRYMALNIFIEYKLFAKRYIWPIIGILTGTITPGRSGPGVKGNEAVLHSHCTPEQGAWPSDTVECHTHSTP